MSTVELTLGHAGEMAAPNWKAQLSHVAGS
jgi:hypothetical protein